MRLHFKTYGRDGAPLVLLHGLFGSSDNWHSISLRLENEFRVLAVDQRNHGQSPHSKEMNYSLMAEDLRQLLEEQGIDGVHVLGHSMGGKTAMAFALEFPQLMKRLIVVDIAPRRYPPLHAHILEALLALDLSQFSTRKEMELALAAAIPDLALRQFLLKNVRRSPDGRFHWLMGVQEIHHNYSHLGSPVTSSRRFEKPALFIRGEMSDYLEEGDLPEIRQLFPTARLETIPAAGHLVHVENSGAFLASVRSFLK